MRIALLLSPVAASASQFQLAPTHFPVPVRRPVPALQEVWSQGQLEALPEVMAPDHVQRDRVWGHGAEAVGRDRMARGIAAFRSSYPDLRFEVTATGVGGDRVFTQWEMAGTPSPALAGSGKPTLPFRARGVSVCQVGADGLIHATEVYRQATPSELGGFEKWVADEMEAFRVGQATNQG